LGQGSFSLASEGHRPTGGRSDQQKRTQPWAGGPFIPLSHTYLCLSCLCLLGKMEEKLTYRGFMQPDRWKLHQEDFRIRMDWEAERQRILDAQAEAIKEKLPYPDERIPPIPALRHPGYHLRTVTPTVTETVTPAVTVTETVTETVTKPETVTPTVTRVCKVCGKPVEGRAAYCSGACRQKFYRSAGMK
jgi:hypothetical protein